MTGWGLRSIADAAFHLSDDFKKEIEWILTFTECPCCLKRYKPNSCYEPVMLPCFDVICEYCMVEQVYDEDGCPRCGGSIDSIENLYPSPVTAVAALADLTWKVDAVVVRQTQELSNDKDDLRRIMAELADLRRASHPLQAAALLGHVDFPAPAAADAAAAAAYQSNLDAAKEHAECSGCSATYRPNAIREAHLLPCGHTVCSACVQGLLNDDLVLIGECPSCDHPLSAPAQYPCAIPGLSVLSTCFWEMEAYMLRLDKDLSWMKGHLEAVRRERQRAREDPRLAPLPDAAPAHDSSDDSPRCGHRPRDPDEPAPTLNQRDQEPAEIGRAAETKRARRASEATKDQRPASENEPEECDQVEYELVEASEMLRQQRVLTPPSGPLSPPLAHSSPVPDTQPAHIRNGVESAEDKSPRGLNPSSRAAIIRSRNRKMLNESDSTFSVSSIDEEESHRSKRRRNPPRKQPKGSGRRTPHVNGQHDGDGRRGPPRDPNGPAPRLRRNQQQIQAPTEISSAVGTERARRASEATADQRSMNENEQEMIELDMPAQAIVPGSALVEMEVEADGSVQKRTSPAAVRDHHEIGADGTRDGRGPSPTLRVARDRQRADDEGRPEEIEVAVPPTPPTHAATAIRAAGLPPTAAAVPAASLRPRATHAGATPHLAAPAAAAPHLPLSPSAAAVAAPIPPAAAPAAPDVEIQVVAVSMARVASASSSSSSSSNSNSRPRRAAASTARDKIGDYFGPKRRK